MWVVIEYKFGECMTVAEWTTEWCAQQDRDVWQNMNPSLLYLVGFVETEEDEDA